MRAAWHMAGSMTRPKQMTYLEMLRGKELLQEMHATHVWNLDAEGRAEHARGCNYCEGPRVLAEISARMEQEFSERRP
jgi:hypothetical protein